MAKEKDPGSSLMQVGFFLCAAPIMAESVSTLWPLFIVGAIIFIIGLMIKVSQSGDTIGRTFAVGINEHLPSSKGVDFLERVVNIADNPNTSTMPIGKQPAGTHPTMGGIRDNEFSFYRESEERLTVDNNSSPNRGKFQQDSYDQYAEHGHERVLPLLDRNPVSGWYNPEDEWQNPVRYW